MLKSIDCDDDIILVSPSKSSYIDVAYYENVMGEDKQKPNYKTYACNIYCVKADWILKDEDGIGMEFMKTMLKKKNRDIFLTPYMKIIVFYLYEVYSKKIKLVLLPPYLAHLILVNTQLFVNEHLRDIREEMAHNPSESLKLGNVRATYISNVVVITCGGFNFLNTLVFIMQSKS